jgi:hypothetical protein
MAGHRKEGQMSAYEAGMISLLAPSRGRPNRCRLMWQSALEHAEDPLRVELLLYLDDDDPTLAEYTAWIRSSDHSRIKDVRGPRILLTKTWNVLLAFASGEFLWHGNDDVHFHTDGWDTQVRQAFERVPDRIALVYPRDGLQNQALATLGFLHRRWVDTMGYLIAPYFSSDYGDTWNNDIAEMLGRRLYLPDVYCEHLHPAAGKARDEQDQPIGGALDLTHRERLARHGPDGNDQRFLDLLPERRAAAERLRALLGTPV